MSHRTHVPSSLRCILRSGLAAVALCAMPAAAQTPDPDLVFSHDFEVVTGDTITAFVGPDAVKSTDIAVDTTGPSGPCSSQHMLSNATLRVVTGNGSGTVSVVSDATIPQDDDWHLVEDAGPVSSLLESWAGGGYDDATLWTRALSDAEMPSLLALL